MQSRSVHGPSGVSLPLMLFAVAAGVAAGFLLAPMPGSAFRARVRGRAADASGRLRTSAASAYQRAKQTMNRLRLARATAGVRGGGSTAAVPLTAMIEELASASEPTANTWGATS